MPSRRSFLTAIGLTAAIGFGAPVMAQSDHPHAKVGAAAPAFTIKDATGKEHSLSDYKGRIVVLQWINPDCPVCRHVTSSGLVNAMLDDLEKIDKDLVYLTVNSTHYMKPDTSVAYLAKHKVKAPTLIDQDGTLGHLYGARTTPHVFVIDDKGILRYQGAFNDDRRGSKGKDAMNYAVNAVRQIKAGETVSPDSTKSYGCSVKYKP